MCTKQVLFAEIGEISEKCLGSFWRNLLDNLPPERRVGKDDDLQELLDDTSRLYNYFSSDSTPIIDFAKEIEPYWAAIRLPEEPEEAEEYDEDEEEGSITIYGDPKSFGQIQSHLEENGYEVIGAEFTYIPNDLKDVTAEERESIDKMVERLEEFDDVQTVYTNMKPEA